MRTTLPEIKSQSILYEDLEPHKGQSHNRSSTDHREWLSKTLSINKSKNSFKCGMYISALCA